MSDKYTDAEGAVVFYNQTGGYGFINTDATERDVFFHDEDIDADEKFTEGDEVVFDWGDFEKGPKAVSMAHRKDTNDDNDSMSYDFITNNDDEEQDDTNDAEADFNTVGSMWTLGDHSTAGSTDRSALSETINETISELDDDIDGDMKDVLQDASRLVQNTRVSTFECPVEECGLGHSHSDHKHDVRQAFDVLDSFTDQMDFCPYCHCGVNELSMLMQFYPYISEQVFADDENFDGVLEVEPGILNDLYRRYVEDNLTVKEAVQTIASEYGVGESDIAGHGIRDDIRRFFSRRRTIERAAQAAPIAQEPRNAIESNRIELEEATSE